MDYLLEPAVLKRAVVAVLLLLTGTGLTGCRMASAEKRAAETVIPCFRVSPEGSFCSIGCYDVSPESPDGTKIAYTKWDGPPTTARGGSGSIWYCSRDLTGHTKIIDIKSVTTHNGACLDWIDNSRLQMRCLDFNGARGAAVVNINGTVELGPYRGMDLLHAAAKGKLLLSGYSGKELFVLDSATGDIRKICDSKSFAQYASLMPEMGDGTDCDSWSVEHATFSRDGLYIALCVSGSGARHSYLFTFTTTFEDVVFFGRKPMHFNWYDDHSTIYGNDREAKGELYNSVRRWGRDGKWIENLAGSPATHNAMSSDKQLFAGESNYSLPAIDLYVHTRDGKSIKIMSHNFKNVTWDMRAHVNPAFSRDGKRLYFNRATSDAMNEVWYADLAAF